MPQVCLVPDEAGVESDDKPRLRRLDDVLTPHSHTNCFLTRAVVSVLM
jgi:hypothetical protein